MGRRIAIVDSVIRTLLSAHAMRPKGILGVLVIALLAAWLGGDDPDLWPRLLGD